MDSVILEEKIDPNYELTEEEYFEYIETLGIQLPEDNDLLYIVHEALKAELPKEWKPCQTKDGQVYYFNFQSGESVWDHPIDSYYREKVKKAKKNRFVELKSEEQSIELELNDQSLSKRKLIEDEFSSYSENLKKEYDNKKNEEKKLIEKSLELKKQKILDNFQQKQDNLLKSNKQKIENFRKMLQRVEQTKEEELKNSVKAELDQEMEIIWKVYPDLLEEEKKKVDENWKSSRKTKKLEIKKANLLEIKQLKEQTQKYKEKFQTEVQVGGKLQEFYEEKLDKSKMKLEKMMDKELKSIESEVNIKDENIEEINENDQEVLIGKKKELEQDLRNFRTTEKKGWNEKLEQEREIIKGTKKLNEKFRTEHELKIKDEIFRNENEQKVKLEQTLSKYKAQKLENLQQSINKHKIDLEKSYAELKLSQNSESTKTLDLHASIKSLQTELNSINSQLSQKLNDLDLLIAEEKLLKAEVLQMDSQESLKKKVKIPSLDLTPKDQSRILYTLSPEKIFGIETDLESIKKSISSNFLKIDFEQCFSEIQKEKTQIKSLQKSLKKDREKWKNDKILYKANPTKQLFAQLSGIKKILDNKIQWHNWRVQELKIIENFLIKKNSIDPTHELKLEMWRGANTRVDTEIYSQLPEEDINPQKMLKLLKKHSNWLAPQNNPQPV